MLFNALVLSFAASASAAASATAAHTTPVHEETNHFGTGTQHAPGAHYEYGYNGI